MAQVQIQVVQVQVEEAQVQVEQAQAAKEIQEVLAEQTVQLFGLAAAAVVQAAQVKHLLRQRAEMVALV
jgi:hypoxanthine-guanine phosphoribosyltransferase